MNKMLLAIALFLPLAAQAEEIIGHGCYRYSDNESLIVARDTALSLAKRDAMERYAVFVESASTVENAQLRNDLINSLSAGLMRGLRVTDQKEDLQKREVCTTIRAEVEAIEVKNIITSRLNAFRRQKENLATGLPETEEYRILKVQQSGKTLNFTGICKRATRILFSLRITWYDTDGIPDRTKSDIHRCYKIGDVFKLKLPIPDPSTGFTYSIDIPK